MKNLKLIKKLLLIVILFVPCISAGKQATQSGEKTSRTQKAKKFFQKGQNAFTDKFGKDPISSSSAKPKKPSKKSNKLGFFSKHKKKIGVVVGLWAAKKGFRFARKNPKLVLATLVPTVGLTAYNNMDALVETGQDAVNSITKYVSQNRVSTAAFSAAGLLGLKRLFKSPSGRQLTQSAVAMVPRQMTSFASQASNSVSKSISKIPFSWLKSFVAENAAHVIMGEVLHSLVKPLKQEFFIFSDAQDEQEAFGHFKIVMNSLGQRQFNVALNDIILRSHVIQLSELASMMEAFFISSQDAHGNISPKQQNQLDKFGNLYEGKLEEIAHYLEGKFDERFEEGSFKKIVTQQASILEGLAQKQSEMNPAEMNHEFIKVLESIQNSGDQDASEEQEITPLEQSSDQTPAQASSSAIPSGRENVMKQFASSAIPSGRANVMHQFRSKVPAASVPAKIKRLKPKIVPVAAPKKAPKKVQSRKRGGYNRTANPFRKPAKRMQARVRGRRQARAGQ